MGFSSSLAADYNPIAPRWGAWVCPARPSPVGRAKEFWAVGPFPWAPDSGFESTRQPRHKFPGLLRFVLLCFRAFFNDLWVLQTRVQRIVWRSRPPPLLKTPRRPDSP